MSLTPLDAFVQYQAGKRSSWAYADRAAYYELMQAYYTNYVYDSLQVGGYKEVIAGHYGKATASLFAGLYNPAQRVIDLYRYIFNGAFGDEILAESDNEAVIAALKQIWKWGNINIEKGALTTFAPLQGTAGIRIVARALPNPRVYTRFETPDRIRHLAYDDRGNVERVTIEYEREESTSGNYSDIHLIREELTPDVFRTYRDEIPYDLVNNQANGRLAVYPNALGVTPYVALKHKHIGKEWGIGALVGQESKIDLLNMLVGHIITQIIRHVKVKWAISASGSAPKEIDLGDTTVVYMQTDPATTTAPSMTPMVSNLSLADAILMASNLLDELRDSLPELKATDGKFLAGQSGETVIQLRQPAEQLILEARAQYEDALIRAQQIALSWGVLLGLWDLGAGRGTRAAADASYTQGLEDHRFNKRPALPLTAYQELELENKRRANDKLTADTIDVLQRAGAISPEEKLKRLHPDWNDDDLAKEQAAINAAGMPNPEALAFDEGSGEPAPADEDLGLGI